MIYTIATSKGGTAKTTTAAILAQAAAAKGKRALAIDLDPQGNLTFALAADATQAGSYDLLHGIPAADLIQTTPQGVDVIPASPNLQTETSAAGSARRLQKALAPIKGNYDFIVIDTPATAGELVYNAMQAADRLIIPLLADGYNVQSLYQITGISRQIQQSNSGLEIAGAILCQYDGRSNIAKYMRETISAKLDGMGIPFLGTVRRSVSVTEAAGLQLSIYDYAPKSNPAQDYMEIYERLTGGK